MSNWTLADAFPTAEAGIEPCGNKVLLQLRRTKPTTRGGIILTTETKSYAEDTIQVCRVVSVGPIAFRNRDTREEWAEGVWCAPGDFVRAPKWGGDRFKVRFSEGEDDVVQFCIVNDHEIIAKLKSDADPVSQGEYTEF